MLTSHIFTSEADGTGKQDNKCSVAIKRCFCIRHILLIICSVSSLNSSLWLKFCAVAVKGNGELFTVIK